MDTLYRHLLNKELAAGEAEAYRFGFMVLLLLAVLSVAAGYFGSLVPLVVLIVANRLMGRRIAGGRMGLPVGVSLSLEYLLLTVYIVFFPAVIPMPLGFLYLFLIYGASLRLDERVILAAGIGAVALGNGAYLYGLFSLQEELPLSLADWPGIGEQLLATGMYLLFTLNLYYRPRHVKRFLSIQQDYFDQIKQDNLSLEKALPELSSGMGLSDREGEVLALLIGGKTYRMIASELFISLDTVKSHVKSIYRKSDVGSRGELISRLRDEALVRSAERE